MATRLFTYGTFKAIPKQNEWLPGVFATAHGVNLNKTGIKAPALDIEYGEIVKLTEFGLSAPGAYKVERVASGTTAFGVILRTTDGQISMEEGIIERPRSRTAMSIYPLASANNFKIAVPVDSAQTPVVGDAVYVSYESGKQGSVRTNVDTNKGIALTGWTFATEKYKPTNGAGYAVVIQRTL